MHTVRSAGLFSVLLVLATACDILGPSGSRSVFGDAPVEEMRAALGTYSVTVIAAAPTEVVTGPKEDGAVLLWQPQAVGGVTQIWKDGVVTTFQPTAGTFPGNAMNNHGDVVGTLDSVIAVWRAGAANPVPLFPSQPAYGAHLVSHSINDRGEILVRNLQSYTSGHGVWKDGEFRGITGCTFWRINDKGFILGDSCQGLYDTWYLSSSPFGSTPVSSGKLAGSQCEYPSVHGRLSYGRFLNDSNEVIDSDNAWVTPSGCVKVNRQVTAFNARGVLVVTETGCVSCIELMTLRGHVRLDSLLSPASAEYRVDGATGINDAGQIVGFVTRKSDNLRLAAFFSRAP